MPDKHAMFCQALFRLILVGETPMEFCIYLKYDNGSGNITDSENIYNYRYNMRYFDLMMLTMVD